MNLTDQVVEKAITGLDENTEKPKNENVETQEEKEVVPDKKDEDPKEEKDPKDDSFAADEVEREGDEEPVEPAQPTEIDTTKLDDESKYIVENLPFITVRLKDGNGVKEVQVKSWTQLPENVEFASKRDELAFVNAITAQENRALALQSKYQQTNLQKQSQDFEKKEEAAMWADVAELQKEGTLPKFTGSRDNPTFKDEAAEKQMEDVIAYMRDRNAQYFKEYQQGRPYRYIGFREAFYLYERSHPAKNEAQVQEDKQRQDIARNTQASRGLASAQLKKPTVKSGTTIDQILSRIDAEEW